jgi:hypothetical protein
MNAKTSILTKAVAAASVAGAMMMTSAVPAAAQGIGSGVVNCGAPGTSQPIGAVVGGLLGAAVGSNLSKNDRTAGTVVGGLAGAAAGSYIGCRNQRAAAARNGTYGYSNSYAPAPAAYNRGYDRSAAGAYVAGTTVNVRAAPSTGAARVGQIGAGQTFQAVGRDGSWLVVSNGSGTGYVHGGYVRSAGYQQAGYGY